MNCTLTLRGAAFDTIPAEAGETLLAVLQRAGLAPEAPCGGHGKCGKCRVILETADGPQEALSCRTLVTGDMTVTLPGKTADTNILTGGCGASVAMSPLRPGPLLAFDIGTTTVVCYLLSGETGAELASASMINPQSPYGADVISRIQYALSDEANTLTACIRSGMTGLIGTVCETAKVDPAGIGVVSVVANPCMQQLFLGIPPQNLARVPFAPVLTRAEARPAEDILPICPNALLLVVPDISGYVGADTMGCVLATRLYDAEKPTLMVDIGTNGEMVLAANGRMAACSTAAGPALEGANIRHGMRGAPGAIDHVSYENGAVSCSVIGGGEARGVCGSGLIDAIAVMLESGAIDKRGRIRAAGQCPHLAGRLDEVDGERRFRLSGDVMITQSDVREVQLAKGAIAAGIVMMAEHLGITPKEIDTVLLAGAFGSFIDPDSACAINLLPKVLQGRIRAVGNAAGSGAKMMACNGGELRRAEALIGRIEFIELAAMPGFQATFARWMRF